MFVKKWNVLKTHQDDQVFKNFRVIWPTYTFCSSVYSVLLYTGQRYYGKVLIIQMHAAYLSMFWMSQHKIKGTISFLSSDRI